MSIMDDCINEVSLLRRIRDIKVLDDFNSIIINIDLDIDMVKTIIEKYFMIVNENKGYNNKVRILDVIKPISINKFNIINNFSCLDLIDFFRYKQYYLNDAKIQDDDIINSLRYDRTATEIVTVRGIEYSWNKRKNYFNILRHKLSFSNSIDILQNGEYIKDKEQDTYKVFSIDSNNTFLVIEYEIANDKKRIISFRKSNLAEYDKAREDSLKWSWIEKR